MSNYKIGEFNTSIIFIKQIYTFSVEANIHFFYNLH